MKPRNTPKDAPKALQTDGKNPTEEYVLKRKWGLNKSKKFRKVRLDTGKICVYWYPSSLE